MRKIGLALAMFAVAGFAATADAGHRGKHGQHGKMGQHGKKGKLGGKVVLKLADVDEDRDVTQDEWDSFLAGLTVDAEGVVDLTALAALLPPRPENAPERPEDAPSIEEILGRVLDRDGDGAVTTDDLNAIYERSQESKERHEDDAATDGEDSDGEDSDTGDDAEEDTAAVAGAEGDDAGAVDGAEAGEGEADAPRVRMGRRAKKAGKLLARLADVDASGDVTAEEWASFQAELLADEEGVFAIADLIALLPEREEGDREIDVERLSEHLARAIDRDGDELTELSDLDLIFDHMDRDDDGALSTEELARRRRRRR